MDRSGLVMQCIDIGDYNRRVRRCLGCACADWEQAVNLLARSELIREIAAVVKDSG